MWRGDPTNGGQNSLDTGFVNNVLVRHQIAPPIIGILGALGIIAVAYFLKTWRLAMVAVFLLLICVPLLILGLIKAAIRVVSEHKLC